MSRDDLPLTYEKSEGVALLTFNRPQARNAISPELACRLADALVDFANDPRLRVAILTGAGDKAFCSGGDLALTLPLMTGARAPETEWDRRLLSDPEVMARSALRDFELHKPVIAAINGHCMAGGMETVLATDIRIAADHATFALPEVRRGLIPFAGALARLPRQIPHCLAMEMLLVGQPMTAAAAREAGLINRVVPLTDLMDTAWTVARQIAANGPFAVQEVKRTVLASSGRTLREGYRLEDEAKARVMASDDAREGPRAFIEKRPAMFTGR
ncbi:enoyl-CoA hydratase/isomerase family protein [Paracoccus sp. (in: a-proteobacteria)]|uniref:enoyl-CoA hydratase/isomerase family protein n=1 Tax=Paracoccus sp. TaxID=267 RepID=UPI003A86D299